MKTGQIFAGIILSLVLIICQIVPAQAVPPIPSSFWGTVTINGENAPAGTEITARIDGIVRANTTVKFYNGESIYSLDVPGEDGPPGDSGDEQMIVFYIGNHPAAQTAVWQSGKNVELNLTALTVPPAEGPVIYLPIIMKR